MKSNPIIAIITPTYNNGELLNRLYKSIKNQTYNSFCWIIVDDGSYDQTNKIVKNFTDINLIYCKQNNSGPNSARNKAEELIPKSCKYVIPIDSDDTFYNHNTLDKMYNDIKNTPKNVGMVGYSTVDGLTGKRTTKLKSPLITVGYEENLKGEIYEGEFIIIQKIEILKTSKWPEDIWGYEAIRHWEINKHYKFIYKEFPGRVYYRDRKDNLTSPESTLRRADNMLKGVNYLLEKHGNNLKKIAISRYNYFLLTKGLYLVLNKEKTKALKHMLLFIFLQKNLKMIVLGIMILLIIPFPEKIIKNIYLFLKRINYNYSKEL